MNTVSAETVETTDYDSLNFSMLIASFIAFTLLTTLSISWFKLKKRLNRHTQSHEATKAMMSKLNSAVTNSGASIIITNKHGSIEYVNQKFCRMTGYLHHEVINKPINVLSANSDKDKDETCLLLDSTCLQESWEGDVLCIKKDQSEFWNAITVSAVYDKHKNITNYVLSAVDITDLKEANRKMQHLALFDSLTGLANRRLFIDRLHQSILNARRHNTITALFFLDLDQFKRINDTLGHHAGDQLLLIIAERLTSCVRNQDTVARLGGCLLYTSPSPRD